LPAAAGENAMNYFAHGRDFVAEPYFMAGTAVPDWLSVVDRRCRVRTRYALEHVAAADPCLAAVAGGIVRHLADDAWFHETPAFAELSWQLSRRVRDRLPPDESFRPHFLGHILVEILLDAVLIADDPGRLEAYYATLDAVDGAVVQAAVNRIARLPVEGLDRFVGLFSRERFLWDYLDDGKLLFRLNQVLRRVKLPMLPADFCELLPVARRMVGCRQSDLLGARAGAGVHSSTQPGE
jgi:hypothetical protein